MFLDKTLSNSKKSMKDNDKIFDLMCNLGTPGPRGLPGMDGPEGKRGRKGIFVKHQYF